MLKKIPKSVIEILKKLEENNLEAYIVGGCVRDLIMGREPKDWDITTNARPEEIMKIFSAFAGATADKPATFYENEFFTVGIKTGDDQCPIVEATTFRVEQKYSDKRHPDEVRFAKSLAEDLGRRDFTINALAIKIKNFEIIDLFEGQKDLENKIIRAVGNQNERFDEDALRMIRAVRFACTLNGISNFQFLPPSRDPAKAVAISNKISTPKSEVQNLWTIEKSTLEAIKKNAKNLKYVSQERLCDELKKIILSNTPSEGIEMLHETGLLEYIIPELEKGYGVKQNRHHIYTIYKHNLLSLKFCPSGKLEVRLAALLHDIAKPETKRGEGENATFYNHDHVGARVAEKILKRLRFSNDIVSKVRLLVDNHMFYYNPDEVGESSVRRLIKKVGLENIKDLIDLRISDRLGSGVPKAKPYKLRHLEYVIDKVSHDAISVKMLKINGNDLMKVLKINPGPKIGTILDVLLAEVIENPEKNTQEYLSKRALELDKIDSDKLRKMAKVKIEEKKEEEDQEIKKKHWVK